MKERILHNKKVASVVLSSSIALSSCGGDKAPSPSPDFTITKNVVSTLIPETSTPPPGITITPATETATPVPTETPAVKGPEYGHASIEQMESVPAEVQAKLKEILEGKDVDIIGNRATVSRDPELADRETCMEAVRDNPKEIQCTSMSDIRLNLEGFSDALKRLDDASPAAVELIRDADGGKLPYIKAYEGDSTNIANIPLTDQDPNKVIISYHFSAAPDDRSMMLPSTTTNISADVYRVGDWMIIQDDIYTVDGIGSKEGMTENSKTAALMNDSVASMANAGYKKAGLEHGGAQYALTSAEGQYIAKNLSSQLYEYFQPGRTTTSTYAEINSIIRVRGDYYYPMSNGNEFTRNNN